MNCLPFRFSDGANTDSLQEVFLFMGQSLLVELGVSRVSNNGLLMLSVRYVILFQ